MKRYRIALTKSATKELERLPAAIHDRVIERIGALEADPRTRGSEKMTAFDGYKLRVGNFRVVYEINEKIKEVRVVRLMIVTRFISACDGRDKPTRCTTR